MFEFRNKTGYVLNTTLYYPDIEICEKEMRRKAAEKNQSCLVNEMARGSTITDIKLKRYISFAWINMMEIMRKKSNETFDKNDSNYSFISVQNVSTPNNLNKFKVNTHFTEMKGNIQKWR